MKPQATQGNKNVRGGCCALVVKYPRVPNIPPKIPPTKYATLPIPKGLVSCIFRSRAKRIGANVTDATAMPFDHQLSSTMDGDGSLSFYCQWPFHET